MNFVGCGTYGFAYRFQISFEGEMRQLGFCVKFCPYFRYKNEQIFFYDNNQRPENSEYLILQLFYVILFRHIERGELPFFTVVCPFFTGIISFKEF
jgi:hypothetical protein